MAKAKQLKEFIKSLDPQKNAFRFCFYNYLTHYTNDNEVFGDGILSDFFNRIYIYEHWQQNQEELLEQITDLCGRFCRNFHFNYPAQQISQRYNWQLINIKKPSDLKDSLAQKFNAPSDNTKKIKIIELPKGQCLVLDFSTKQDLQVQVFHSTQKINNGVLEPLSPITHLTYNHALQLTPHHLHTLSINDHTFAHLYIAGASNGYGHLIRGYSLQRHSRIEFNHLNQVPDVYRHLKQLEYHYIHAKSDPEYIELTCLLEKSTQMLINNDPGHEKLARSTYQKAQFAVENIFPNDKYLKLLLSQLELAIVKHTRKNSADSRI